MRTFDCYQWHAVSLVWQVDPWQWAVDVCSLGLLPRLLREGDTLEGGEVLLGGALPVADAYRWSCHFAVGAQGDARPWRSAAGRTVVRPYSMVGVLVSQGG
jgi:hypothetical protein